jgi:hypothetical protein
MDETDLQLALTLFYFEDGDIEKEFHTIIQKFLRKSRL